MTPPNAYVIALGQEFTLRLHSFTPSLASIFIHITPPQKAMSAAISSEAVQPQWSASQGVRLGEMGPSKGYGAKSSASRVRTCARVTSVIVPTTKRLLYTVRI
ncbi:MAG: hypothetical protein H8K10_00335 [Nitrospira sp.]|nr:hypothetical protein [Nitrospira sp.]